LSAALSAPLTGNIMMKCNGDTNMSIVWTAIIVAIVLWIVYSIASAKRQACKHREAREARLPCLEDAPRTGPRYDLQLSDGRVFAGVELIGTTEVGAGVSTLGDWGPMLIFIQASGKKTYVRPSAVRWIQEA
jgi:hypothetical protein